MIWECSCGQSATKVYELALKFVCPLCAGRLEVKEELSLAFWNKHDSFKDLSEDFLVGKRRNILNAIRDIQPCSDRDISIYLGIPINQVTGRRNELANCSIPFIIPFGDKVDGDTKKRVTTWIPNVQVMNNNIVDVEREIEAKVRL